MFVRIALAVGILVVLILVGSAISTKRKQRRMYAQTIRAWSLAQADRRSAAMQDLLDQSPLNAPAWYLLGCARLRQYNTKQAARAFGMAHHADAALETAALLTFACLKAADGEDSDLLEQITVTWEEMKRPDLLRQEADRLMLACLEAQAGCPPSLSPLGRLAWLVSGPAVRSRLGVHAASDDPRWSPLRGSEPLA